MATINLSNALYNKAQNYALENNMSVDEWVSALILRFVPTVKRGRKSNVKEEVTPNLQDKLDKAREEYKNGNYVSCSTKDELHAFLDNL